MNLFGEIQVGYKNPSRQLRLGAIHFGFDFTYPGDMYVQVLDLALRLEIIPEGLA